tara:strand:+ start:226 stop:651 length:426 start_codon:yes stop_codon:yes gene_type:complete
MTSTKSSTKQKLADPRPKITEEDGHYLVVGGQCSECDYSMITAPPLCPRCGNSTMKEETFGPKGKVFSSTVMHFSLEGRKGPTTLAYIDLEQGPRLLVHINNFSEDYGPPPGSIVTIVGQTEQGDPAVIVSKSSTNENSNA